MASFDEVIPPGREGTVRAEVDTKHMIGPVAKGISVYTNDPGIPNVRVGIRAQVVGSVQVLPGYETLLSNRRSYPGQGAFLLRKEADETGELRIGTIETSVPWLAVDAQRLEDKRPPTGDGLPTGFPGDWLLQVRPLDSAPPGRSTQAVRFTTGLQREPRVELTVRVDLEPAVTLNASEFTLRSGEAKTILASLRRDLAGQELVARTSDGLSARVEPGRGRFYKIHLEWTGAPKESELTLEIGGETQTVPVRPGPG